MKRWLGISLWAVAGLTGFAIVTLAVFVWLLLVPSRTYQKIGGRWSPAAETSLTAKSGRKPKYLVPGGVFLRKAVAEDITDFQYLGPLCQ